MHYMMSYELYWRRVAGALGSTDKVDLYLRPALEPWREIEGKQEPSFASPNIGKREMEKGKK